MNWLDTGGIVPARTPRALEWTIFGMIAAFSAWLQIVTHLACAPLRAVVPGQRATVFRLAGLAATLRWFVLGVLYGRVLPNTWQRCDPVVVSLALLPVGRM